ncbi:insulinase family protein|uniref:M16 family metallopeptidase n=1 Tax=Stenotrophomonas sp. SbOxS2 TaxID=2723885 RepID=UPI0015D2CA37|nr:pitrilysin family protein [Stenotrophomonas sp. SbOxS2]NYT99474.1 insulinase family protein [Stenotrophomonas sp. SbOxS2]
MKRHSFLLVLCLACFAGWGSVAAAHAGTALPPGVSAGASVEGISEYRLDNGLRVLLYPDASTPTMLVNVTYAVGAAQENYGESGMAHLLEHLLFKGTPSVKNISAEFKRRGITYNGTTSHDRTNYYGWFPANEQTLDWLLTVEADRMVNANVAKQDLDSEMTVVRNELEIGENKPSRILLQRMTAQAFLWHAYGKSVIGNRDDVENVPIERLQAFYRTWYQPDNATVIIAGSFDLARALATVKRTFGALPRPTRKLPGRYTLEPAQDGEREINIRRVGELHMIALGYHAPAAGHPDAAAMEVMDSIMGTVPSGRLHKALVVTRLAANIDDGVDSFLEPGLAGFYATPVAGSDPAQVEKILLEQVEGLAAHPFTEEEVTSAKQRLANLHERVRNGSVIGIANGLSESIAAGDWRLDFVRRDAIGRVTAEDVNRVARTYLVRDNRTLARFIPTAKPGLVKISPAPPIASLVGGYTGLPAVATGEVFDGTPENIQARTETLIIGNGLKVALLPKRSRGDRVDAILTFHFGDEASLSGRADAAMFAGRLLMHGSKTMSREQIAKRFDDLKARVQIVGTSQMTYVSVKSSRENLVPALRVVADVLRNPVFPESEFAQLRTQSIAGLVSNNKEPGYIADHAMRTHFDPYPAGHPEAVRSQQQELADINALTLEQVRAFHRDFYGTSVGEVAVVGNFDPEQMKQELRTLFAGWSSPKPFVQSKKPYFQPSRVVREQFESPDKANAVVVSRSNFPIQVEDPDHAALLVAGRIFGGGAMSSRLGDRVRGKEGLSYYVGAGVIVDPLDGNGTFYMQATAAPENAAKVEKLMSEELRRFVSKGITEQELVDAKSALLESFRDGRSTDGVIASNLRQNLYLGRTMHWDAEFERRTANLTVDQVSAAIKRRLKPELLSTFVAGDFAGSKRRIVTSP